MCKLFAILDIENKHVANRFAAAAVPFVTKTDNHGLGIMRLGENGVHTRRWLAIPEPFREMGFAPQLQRYEAAFSSRFVEAGVESEELHAIAIHGRMATCEKTMANVHPFFSVPEGTALMHNGIINNPLKYTRKLSTCDSEALLWQYIEHEVRDNPDEIGNALNGMNGYYAAIVFNNNGIVDIWRDDRADLVMAYVEGVGTIVCTTIDIINEAAKKEKKKVIDFEDIYPYTSIRWKKDSEPEIREFTVTKGDWSYTPPAGTTVVDEEKATEEYWKKQGEEWDQEKAELDRIEAAIERAEKSHRGGISTIRIGNGVYHSLDAYYAAKRAEEAARLVAKAQKENEDDVDGAFVPGGAGITVPETGIVKPSAFSLLDIDEEAFKRNRDLLEKVEQAKGRIWGRSCLPYLHKEQTPYVRGPIGFNPHAKGGKPC